MLACVPVLCLPSFWYTRQSMEERLKQILTERWLHLVSLILALVGLGFVYSFTAKRVLVLIDGSQRSVRTHARNVENLLADLSLSVQPEDRLNVTLSKPISDEMIIAIKRARDIAIVSTTGEEIIHSAATSPANILSDGGIRIFPGDEVWVDGVTRILPWEDNKTTPGKIRLKNGRSFSVLIDGDLQSYRSSAPTVGSALLDRGVPIFEGDRVQPALDGSLEQGATITIERARQVVVRLADKEMHLQSAGMTVGEVLIGAGLALTGMDYSVPDLEAPVPKDRSIQIVQVEEDVLVELEPLAFDTVYQPVDTLELDQLQVQSMGTFGVQAERIRIRYEDGEEVSRKVEEAVTVVEPEPRVIGYGTKIVVRTINTGSGTIEYWRAVPVYATSYSPCRLGVDRCGFVTASGTSVKRGTIGVIRSWFNQMRGWPVYVPGYGSGSIQDIGAGFSDRDWIDLGFTDDEYEAWHDWTTLYFLTPVPSLDQIPWILP
jgi:uncharacterized protein YabE (DUF348 family)